MVVREEEGDGLVDDHPVERLEVLAEEGLVVAARQRHAEDIAARRVRGEPRDRLLARAAHADEQRVAARQAHEPVDAHDVVEAVVKEDEVHGLVGHVVLLDHLVEDGLDRVEVRHVLVEAHRVAAGALVLDGVVRQKVSEEDRVGKRAARFGREVLLHRLLDLLVEEGLVLVADHPVVEDAEDLVPLEADGGGDAVDLVGHHLHDPLGDAPEIAQVEDVVELGGGGRQRGDDGVEDVHHDGGAA